jgi:hypothetical protein
MVQDSVSHKVHGSVLRGYPLILCVVYNSVVFIDSFLIHFEIYIIV